MAKLFKLLFIGLFVYLSICLFVYSPVYALECDDNTLSHIGNYNLIDLNGLSDKCNQAISSMEKAVQPSRDELARAEKAIAVFQDQIKIIEADVTRKTAQINEGERELGDNLVIATRKIRQFYMRSYAFNSLALFFSSGDIGTIFRNVGYQQAVVNEDKKTITQIAVTVKDLEDRKTSLVSEQATLAKLKADTDARAASLRTLVGQAMAYESKVQGWISQISAAQQQFLQQKLAGLGIPLFAISGGGCSSDLTNGKDPGFSGGFGFFTYGVPNRVGLDQYGALGRAKAGQDDQTILRAYYNFDSISNFDTNTQIHVDGYGSYSLEDYVKRVYEVPDSWTDNNLAALKAQAIAVRSYVLAYTNKGAGSICTTQQCQVFQPNPKGGNWDAAVNATAGQVMMQGGNPIKAFFSSTHGGYVYATGDLEGWSATSYTKRAIDTPSGSVSSFSDLQSNAYDKASPWFYCDWGGRSQYGGTAWLRSDELADIINVMILAQRDSSAQPHLVQTDKPNPDGVDTWDAGTVRSKLGSSAYNSISSVSVNADYGTGRVTSVTLSGDAGTNTFDGNNFKTYFNLRAPANIQIVGPLYNVERH